MVIGDSNLLMFLVVRSRKYFNVKIIFINNLSIHYFLLNNVSPDVKTYGFMIIM